MKKEYFKYIYFRLGGEVKRLIIRRRLTDFQIDSNHKYGLHLDLSDTNQIELFEDFLFSFLLLKEYIQNEDIKKMFILKMKFLKGFMLFQIN